MLTIRLSRTGKRHKPQYRIVVQEKHQDPWAPAKEIVGLYNPHTQPSTIELKEDSIKEWLSKGAQPSETVHNMLVNAGIIKGDKMNTVTISKKRRAKLDEKKAASEEKAAADKVAAEEAAKAEAEAEAPAEPEVEAPKEEATETPAEEAKTEEAPAEEVKKEEAPAEAEAPKEEAKEEEKAEESAE